MPLQCRPNPSIDIALCGVVVCMAVWHGSVRGCGVLSCGVGARGVRGCEVLGCGSWDVFYGAIVWGQVVFPAWVCAVVHCAGTV